MRNVLEGLDRLAARARREKTPQGDVSRSVLARLPVREMAMRRPMLVFAGAYAAVASVALVYGYILLEKVNNPLLPLFQQATLGL